jgi:hypothetical protein
LIKAVDERLIRRGELLLSLDFLEGCEDELHNMNLGKVLEDPKMASPMENRLKMLG